MDLVRNNIFLKPEDGRGEIQRPVGWFRVRHPGSLQVLLIFTPGGKRSMLHDQHFGRLPRRRGGSGFFLVFLAVFV